MDVRKLIDAIAFNNHNPSLDELEAIVSVQDDDADYLFKVANEVRKIYCGDDVQIRAIIEFSNYCRCKCAYCGLNAQNTEAQRYRMSIDEIVATAKVAMDAGYKTLVLQSGEDMWFTVDRVCDMVKKIKALGDIAITLSLGERSYEDYEAFMNAGADRYLMKHETADEKLYNKLHPHSSFEQRVQCLKWIKELGYQTGSGFMIGLPGQTYKTIAKDILLLKDIGVHMAGIGPFIPHEKTELKDGTKGSAFLTLKAVATTRLVLKDAMLPVTTALGILDEKNKHLAFNSGANVIMQKVQDIKYRKLYDIYPKPDSKELTVLEQRKIIEDLITSSGRTIGYDRGDYGKLK